MSLTDEIDIYQPSYYDSFPTMPTFPNTPLILRRTLSYINDTYDHALTYANECNEGDTILINYFMDQENRVIGHYLQKIKGEMVQREFEESLRNVQLNWTFDLCPFPIRTLYED